MIPERIIEELTGKISVSVERVLLQMKEKAIETEPNITDQLLANIKRDFEPTERYSEEEISVKTRSLRDRGRNAPENKYGADLATLLNVNLAHHSIQKGFLAQAKWIKRYSVTATSIIQYQVDNIYLVLALKGLHNSEVNVAKEGTIEIHLPKVEYERMEKQCRDMLNISSSSFIFIYTSEDIYVIAASAILSTPFLIGELNFYCKNLKSFMTDYLKSFLGDTILNGTSDSDFDDLMTKTGAMRLLYLQVVNR